MNIFNKEEKAAQNAEKREKDFIRERDAVNSASNDDSTYLHEQDRRSDLLRWQQEFDMELEGLYHELLSEEWNGKEWIPKKYKEWDEKKKTYVLKDVKPLCSPEFAEKIIRTAVKPFMNKNTVNSNLTEKTILKMLRNTHNEVVGLIADGWGSHQIETVDSANAITRTLKNYTDPAAFRALNGWTKKMDSSMIKRLESQHELAGQEKENKGLWGLLGSG